MGKIKDKQESTNEWQAVELSTEEHTWLAHFDVYVQTQLAMHRELMRDYLNTIATRHGFDANESLEFSIDEDSAVVKIRVTEP